MRYTQPRIIKIEDAVSAIQSTGSTSSSKPSDGAVDTVKSCTPNGYEADE
jgi:hypothetical protein